MPIPDYQTLMRPVLAHAAKGEVRIGALIETLSNEYELTPSECEELIPSGKQAVIANRVHWAKTYLKQAGLVEPTRRAHFIITDRGKTALSQSNAKINISFLKQFEEFVAFQGRSKERETASTKSDSQDSDITPDEALRAAHKRINDNLAADLLDRVRNASPVFFENLLVTLFVAMGYGLY